MQALLWGLYALALLLIIGRIQARIAIREKLNIDDFLSIQSFILLTVQTVLHTLIIQPYHEVESVFRGNSTSVTSGIGSPSLEDSVSKVLRYSFVRGVIGAPYEIVYCVLICLLIHFHD